MRIDNSISSGGNYGVYKGCVAYEDYHTSTMYVFTDVSVKRLTDPHRKFTKYNHYKVMFVTNAMLKTMTRFEALKEVVFDSKEGMRYRGGSCSGSYMFCLHSAMQKETFAAPVATNDYGWTKKKRNY